MSHHTQQARRLSILDFPARKAANEKISMVTCYDYTSAQVLNDTDVDTLLVGDSLAMVIHGFDSTVHATVELMALHVAAVARGAPNKFIVGDMPFLAARKGLKDAMDGVQQLMQGVERRLHDASYRLLVKVFRLDPDSEQTAIPAQ